MLISKLVSSTGLLFYSYAPLGLELYLVNGTPDAVASESSGGTAFELRFEELEELNGEA